MVLMLYGLIGYLTFFVAFLYAIGFTGGFLVPKCIDAGAHIDGGTAVTIDLLLLSAFALQHSIMARPAFKRWWTSLIPRPAERPTYVLLASLLLLLLYWQWRPLSAPVWDLTGRFAGNLLWTSFFIGWLVVFVSTFMIGHFELFGLLQPWMHMKGREMPKPALIAPGFYKGIRHPIMLGFIVAFWSAPRMSQGHLLFSVVTTAYILVAIQIEERDLVSFFGDAYVEYRKRTSMLLPIQWRK